MAQRKRIPYLLVAFVVFFLPSLALASFGIQLHTVTTGSMRPEIKPGDLVITRLEIMSSVQKGQVILFYDLKSKSPISHRVISVVDNGLNVNVTTKGDANPIADGTITEPRSFKIAKVVTVVAGMGWVVAALHTPAAKYLLVGLLALLIIMYVVEKRFGSKKEEKVKDKLKIPDRNPYVVEGKSHV